jgi:S1-C subfamily serine protease
MITNMGNTSGGSGSIIKVSRDESLVLTNSHVCEVAKDGGIVHTYDNKSIPVAKYKQSNLHDLCIISVSANLKHAASIADYPPSLMDEIIVVGHPKLFPVIMTKGHISSREITKVMTGNRECTQAELEDPVLGFI